VHRTHLGTHPHAIDDGFQMLDDGREIVPINVQQSDEVAAIGRTCRTEVVRAACTAARDGVVADGGVLVGVVAVYDVLDVVH
jgi:hypothetical protein